MSIPPDDIKVILCGAEQLNIRETMEYNNESKSDDDEYAAGRRDVEAKEDPIDTSDEGDDTSEDEEEGKSSRALKGRKSKSHADGSDDMDADIKAEYQRRLLSSKVRAPKGGAQHVVISKPGQRIKVGRVKRTSM